MNVNICPSTLAPGYSTYSPQAIQRLFDGIKVSHNLTAGNPGTNAYAADEQKEAGRVSLSGVQPKRAMVVDHIDMRMRFTKEGEQGTYIAKPVPFSPHLMNREYCPANENLSMQLASQVYGIDTASNGLAFFPDDTPVYITKRFDVGPNTKYAQEDFAALMGYTRAQGGSEYKYCNGSYEECGEIIRKYVDPWLIDTVRFFDIILFNFLILNDDAHLKNFSLSKMSVEYRLSPAYDLINTSLHISTPRIFALDKGLFREGMAMSDVNAVGKKDFEELGRRLNIPEKVIKKEIDKFSTQYPQAQALIHNSYLSAEMQRQYWMSYDYRRKMLSW